MDRRVGGHCPFRGLEAPLALASRLGGHGRPGKHTADAMPVAACRQSGQERRMRSIVYTVRRSAPSVAVQRSAFTRRNTHGLGRADSVEKW